MPEYDEWHHIFLVSHHIASRFVKDEKLMHTRFSAFDEPWKVQFNTPGKEWEDKWGLMDVNRNLKSGVKIPSCSGSTLPS